MAKQTTKIVAEICLYGNGAADVGYGWLARLSDGAMLGNGEPRPGRSQTDCLWQACDHVRRLRTMAAQPKPWTGTVRVFAPGGKLMADTDLNHPGYFGDLKWQPATALEISAEAIEAAASK